LGGSGEFHHNQWGHLSGSNGRNFCSALSFTAPVSSPNPSVVDLLQVGTKCTIVLQGTPPQLQVLLADTGETLGAITDRWQDLVSCINEGNEYVAEVTEIQPVVRVRISHS
jgi:hypothetical protein